MAAGGTNLSLRAFRGIAIAAPLCGAAAVVGEMLEQNYQRALCAQFPGADPDYVGGGDVGLLNIAILCAPWLVMAGCQIVGWRQKLRRSELWRLVVIAYSAAYGLAVWEYVLPPVANAEQCSLGFWRHQLVDVIALGGGALILAIVSLLMAALTYFNIRMARNLARGHEQVM
jgi:hypothetical protein